MMGVLGLKVTVTMISLFDWYENPNNGETNKVESVVAADPVAKKANSAASSPQVGTVTKISVTMLAGFVLLLVVVL